MKNSSKIRSIIEIHNKEIKRLKEILESNPTKGLKKAVVTQIKHSEKAVSRLTGRLEKQGIIITQSKKKTDIAPKKIKSRKNASRAKGKSKKTKK